MLKPIANLDELEFTDIEDNGYYTSRRAQFSAGIGARKLGYNLTELPPGKAQCPFHSHRPCSTCQGGVAASRRLRMDRPMRSSSMSPSSLAAMGSSSASSRRMCRS